MDKTMVNTSFVLICVAVLCVIIACVIVIIVDERRAFNGGICKLCGNKLRYFDTDSQGGRGYCCDKCGHHIWVSWKFVDKDYNYVEPTNAETETQQDEKDEEKQESAMCTVETAYDDLDEIE